MWPSLPPTTSSLTMKRPPTGLVASRECETRARSTKPKVSGSPGASLTYGLKAPPNSGVGGRPSPFSSTTGGPRPPGAHPCLT